MEAFSLVLSRGEEARTGNLSYLALIERQFRPTPFIPLSRHISKWALGIAGQNLAQLGALQQDSYVEAKEEIWAASARLV